jgi:hypothetical protein
MARLLKLLHLIGLALFVGSILCHVVASVLGGAPGGSAEFIAARRQILLASEVVTMPGLALAVASGLGMALLARRRQPWMWVHGSLGLVVLALALVVVMPTVSAILDGALAVAAGSGDGAAVAARYQVESLVGGLNLVLSLAIMALGIWRPRFGSAPAGG